MRYSSREKFANYFDLVIVFFDLDIFLLILFELSRGLRPFVYDIGKILIAVYVFENIIQFFLNPRLYSYARKNWSSYAVLFVLIFLNHSLNRIPQSNQYLLLYSKLFLGAIEIVLVTRFMLRINRLREISKSFRVSPAQLIIMSFGSIILIGSFLLYFPYSRAEGSTMRYIDALFTSTSAVCVTGLTVVDTGSAFSRVGHVILLMLIQSGGIGIMTIAAFIQVSLGSEMSLYGRFSTAALLDQTNLKNLYMIIRSIVLITFVIELFGFLLFVPYFLKVSPSHWKALFYSLFHSVSAFCNAGFSLFPDSFLAARANVWVNLVLISLIVSGGLGFTVLLNLMGRMVKGQNIRITVQTRIVLVMTLFFILFGTVNIYLLEQNHAFFGLRNEEKVLASLFQSVTTRTAGFNTVGISLLRARTLFMMSIQMFVGASPGSTGGGIKTTTLFVLILSIITIFRDQKFNTIFKRRIPYQVVNRAVAIMVSSVAMVIAGTLMLGFSEKFSFIQIYFETVSAFGTVGLSTGITPYLSDFGKIVIILCMFVGRIGPLTMVLAIRNVQGTRLVKYPQERVMVG
jgi:trk system potassium uptake protein TrkH